MNRSTTSKIDTIDDESRLTTPIKTKIRDAIEFCEAMNIPYFKSDVFRVFDVSKRADWQSLNSSSSSSSSSTRRRHNNVDLVETRDRKSVISEREIREMERILETKGIESRNLTWKQLSYEVGLECTGRSWSQLCFRGFKKVTTSYWKRTATSGMILKRQASYESGRSQTTWITISIVLHHLICL